MDSVSFTSLVFATELTLLMSYRIIRGPMVPNRVVALDAIGTNVVVIVALYAIWSRQGYFVGISLMLDITGFTNTTTVAWYVTGEDIIE